MTRPFFKMRSARRLWTAFSRTGLFVFLIHILASGVRAQFEESLKDADSPGLVIESAAGWDGTVDLTTPVPLSFLIRNDSDHIIEGRLRLSDPMRGHEVLLEEVVVAPGTARRVTSIQAMTDWFECFATLSNGMQVLWRRELPLRTGNEFLDNVNFALFIDDSGRRLELPGAVTASAALATSEIPVAGSEGRPIKCLTVKSWEVPNHPGPLVVAQALIFPEGAAEEQLNAVQWQAVAEWMCQGGAVFVHRDSAALIDRLTHSAPLDADPAVPSSGFVRRRVGLGAIYEYSEPLLPFAGGETRRRVGETIARLTKSHISTLLESANWYNWRGGRADLNRVLVVTFFGFYTFFSGVLALMLFRLSQRRVGVYTVSVVVGASLLSGLLGGYLRYSRGDLHWMTVTQAGAGGVVQVGRIEVQSAGGRNTHVAINGTHADLQFIGGEQRYYPWYPSQTGFPPFTWQPSLAPKVRDTYQVNVTMTPWGRRRLHSTAYQRGVRPLECKLEFEPRGFTDNRGMNMPSGAFRLTLVNRLPHDFKNGWLVIGVTAANSAQSDGLLDVYQQHQLQPVPAGEMCDDTFDAEFQIVQNDWDRMIHLPGGSLSPPRIARLGAASAWIIALINDSPIMSIDEQRSDFAPREYLHLFVQEIRPEDMPDAAIFFSPEAAAAPDQSNDGTR